MRYLIAALAIIIVVVSCHSTRRIIDRMRKDSDVAHEVLYEALHDPHLKEVVYELTPIDTVVHVERQRDTVVMVDTMQLITTDTVRMQAYVRYDTMLFLPDSSAAVIVVVGDGGVHVDLLKYKGPKVITKRVVETQTVTRVQTIEKPVYVSVPRNDKREAWPPWLAAIRWVAIALIVMSVTSFLYRLLQGAIRRR